MSEVTGIVGGSGVIDGMVEGNATVRGSVSSGILRIVQDDYNLLLNKPSIESVEQYERSNPLYIEDSHAPMQDDCFFSIIYPIA